MSRRKRGLLLTALIAGAGLLLLGAAELSLAAESSSNRDAEYLRMGAGARALGMGGAFVAVSDDATAMYWNPAGLAWTSGWEVTGMYTAGMDVDRRHNYVGVSRNTSQLAYGLQWINAGMRDIPQYDADATSRGTFNFTDNAFSLSLAKGFDMFALGITGKYLHESNGAQLAGSDSHNGFGLDLGLGVVPLDWARFGVSVQNLAGKLGAKDAPDEVKRIPATLRAGVALIPVDGLTTAFDVEKTRDDHDYYFHAGAEFAIPVTSELGTALRVGLNHDRFAGGIGLRYNFLTFDYAYVVEPQQFLNENHRFSVTLNLGQASQMPSGRQAMSDRDGDGIPDNVDQCPDLAEDFDGFADTDGCPDLDNDGDGIPDVNDDCPNKAEDFEGYQDTDGCPEGGPPAAPAAVAPSVPAIPTLAYINFKFNKDEISGADPVPVLEDVARIMKERPDIKLQITGHTDAIGGDQYNMKLSLRRAEAVKKYLVAKGIDPDRLITVGKGETQPIDTNDTEIGRARNRRIEFSVIQ